MTGISPLCLYSFALDSLFIEEYTPLTVMILNWKRERQCNVWIVTRVLGVGDTLNIDTTQTLLWSLLISLEVHAQARHVIKL